MALESPGLQAGMRDGTSWGKVWVGGASLGEVPLGMR